MPTAYVVWVFFANNLHFVSRLAWLHQKVWPEHKPDCNAQGSRVPQRNEWPQCVALPLVPVSCSSWRGELGLAQTRSAAPALTAVCSNLWQGKWQISSTAWMWHHFLCSLVQKYTTLRNIPLIRNHCFPFSEHPCIFLHSTASLCTFTLKSAFIGWKRGNIAVDYSNSLLEWNWPCFCSWSPG